MNEIDIDEIMGRKRLMVQCQACRFKWFEVRPIQSDIREIECPQCHLLGSARQDCKFADEDRIKSEKQTELDKLWHEKNATRFKRSYQANSRIGE